MFREGVRIKQGQILLEAVRLGGALGCEGLTCKEVRTQCDHCEPVTLREPGLQSRSRAGLQLRSPVSTQGGHMDSFLYLCFLVYTAE